MGKCGNRKDGGWRFGPGGHAERADELAETIDFMPLGGGMVDEVLVNQTSEGTFFSGREGDSAWGAGTQRHERGAIGACKIEASVKATSEKVAVDRVI